jgi:hypothetical protein
MRIVDPTTGKAYLEKRRKRFNDPGQPRERTFSCYRRLPFLARLRETEGRRVRRRFGQPGGGHDRNSTSTETLPAVIEHLHANPLRRGLFARAEDWEWSSARWSAGIRLVPILMGAGVLEELAADRTIPRSCACPGEFRTPFSRRAGTQGAPPPPEARSPLWYPYGVRPDS